MGIGMVVGSSDNLLRSGIKGIVTWIVVGIGVGAIVVGTVVGYSVLTGVWIGVLIAVVSLLPPPINRRAIPDIAIRAIIRGMSVSSSISISHFYHYQNNDSILQTKTAQMNVIIANGIPKRTIDRSIAPTLPVPNNTEPAKINNINHKK